MSNRNIGVVTHVRKDRGFFFILCEGQRYFAHISNWTELDLPDIGTKVSFELGPGRSDPTKQQAVMIKPVEAEKAEVEFGGTN